LKLEEIAELYKSTAKDGAAFVTSLYSMGYRLAKSTRGAYVIIDDMDSVHSLSRAAGVKVSMLRKTLRNYPLQDLLSVEQIFAENIELDNQLSVVLFKIEILNDSSDMDESNPSDEMIINKKVRLTPETYKN
jgi:hypothetical protein